MRLQDNGDSIAVWISARETYNWARKPGAVWPCSTLADKRLFAAFDTNGLCEITVNGSGDLRHVGQIDNHEFSSIMADHIKTRIGSDHPVYFVTVGQFE